MRILRVDLTAGKMHDQEISKEDCVKFLGGRGLAAKILYEENKSKIDAFDPENRLIFMAGPYTGTLGSFTAFYNVTTQVTSHRCEPIGSLRRSLGAHAQEDRI